MADAASDYLGPEAQARVDIDRQLSRCGWVVQRYRKMNLGAGSGVAIREFPMAEGHGDADYLLFVDRKAVGVIEAKKKGSTLTGVEWQSAKYTTGLPDAVPALTKPLAFAYESTGVETRFTNGFDPEPASRQVFTFHRPETLAGWVRACSQLGGIERSTFRQRLRQLPLLDPAGLWPAQETAIRNLEVSLGHFRPRALIQMVTGSGKTFTAANIAYRLIKQTPVASSSTFGLGEVADAEGVPGVHHAGRRPEVHRALQRPAPPDEHGRLGVTGRDHDHPAALLDPAWRPRDGARARRSVGVRAGASRSGRGDLQPKRADETFDVVIVDECHRSIYGVRRQVHSDARSRALQAERGVYQNDTVHGRGTQAARGNAHEPLNSGVMPLDVLRGLPRHTLGADARRHRP